MAALRSNALVRRLAHAYSPAGWDKDYDEFVRATGFDFERDVRSLTIGVSGAEGARITDAVIDGNFDHGKVDGYMASYRKTTTVYNGHQIDTFVSPSGRTFHLTFLDGHRLLFSNARDPGNMRSMLDAGLRAGNSLAHRFREVQAFEHVPAGSQIWLGADVERGAILKLPTSPGSDTSFTSDLLRGARVALIAARLDGRGAELRLSALYATPAEAQHAADSLNSLRALLRVLAQRQPSAGKQPFDFARALDAVSISVDKSAAVAAWPVDAALIEYLAGGAAPPKP